MISATMHPLDGAHARITRARTHLRSFKVIERKFPNKIRRVINVSDNWEPFAVGAGQVKHGRPFGISTAIPAVPPRASILVGEVLYNLRSALDYLVYELARLDSGTIQEGTQFPIEDKATSFEQRCDESRKRGVYLRGLSEKHKAMIRDLQPCHGCDWTGKLRDLSNPDKHRELLVASVKTTLISDDLLARAREAGGSLEIYGEVPARILFSDGQPIIETIEQFIANVSATLDRFRVEFKSGRPS
jgi:hypothetical protein